ncbi:MAG TPA: serine hydrolase [Ktedonobacterales bacterium]|nr:serine hydrolase [Ktedonobacterales bacterium]
MGRLIGPWWLPRALAWSPSSGGTPRRVAASMLMVGLVLEILTGTSFVQRAAPRRASAAAWLAALPQTAPDPAGDVFIGQSVPTDARFQAYYDAHAGATTLGPALTPALPQVGGWVQVFTSGALFLPGASPARTPPRPKEMLDAVEAFTRLVPAGTTDAATGVVALPLLPALLAAGSQVPIGGADSALTYADLRRAIYLANPPPTRARRAAAAVVMGMVAGASPPPDVIPSASSSAPRTHPVATIFRNALLNPDFAPDGWRTDFGSALTGVLSATTGPVGQREIVSVQVFQRQVLVSARPLGPASINAPTASVARLPVGLDYLRTFGPPVVFVARALPAWTTDAAALLTEPGAADSAVAHVGPAFPLTLTGATTWANGALWYAATWRGAAAEAWLPAGAVTLSNPGATASAAMDALSPDLAAYLAGLGGNVGVVVNDVSRGITYSYNGDGAFTVASSVKVPIMLALLTQLEAQHRGPDDNEMGLLTTMIENSNNDSAQALYEEIGDAPGLSAFMQGVGISGLDAAAGAWGWSTITPTAMVRLLGLLQAGAILTPADRALALNLMENVESDEQVGVGTTAPAGATVALKDGWVNEPDGLWAMNSSGIVTVGGETYIIAVYTGEGQTLDDGWAITEHVSDAVARALT